MATQSLIEALVLQLCLIVLYVHFLQGGHQDGECYCCRRSHLSSHWSRVSINKVNPQRTSWLLCNVSTHLHEKEGDRIIQCYLYWDIDLLQGAFTPDLDFCRKKSSKHQTYTLLIFIHSAGYRHNSSGVTSLWLPIWEWKQNFGTYLHHVNVNVIA